MLVPCLVALAVAGAAIFLSLNTTEEIVKVAAVGTAGLFLVLSLFFAPWIVKVAVLAAPLTLSRIPGLGFLAAR
ncbi:MAG: hypothetical protein J7641_11290 [Cyanobacteria bacterium SID2]|nr:hypothetical protein [Cyanobacteria bacterium SID2]MBP0004665.1 hypothetical protein [Cyanobacteria bacterium SBC]